MDGMSTAHTGPREPLSAEQVRKVARLARLGLSDEQVEQYRGQLAAVLAYVERLRDLDLSDVEPLANPVEEVNRLRADEPGPTLPRQTLLEMAPCTDGPFVAVPKVIGGGDGP
jgi:aspartyl-tRNA(Asn)/glutamyl-tRNA(Gln) amidotransferase subunit C